MKLIVATCPSFFVEENAILDAFFNEGLDYLHLRKPDSDPVYCERLLTLLDSKWRKRIVVNDHFYLKDEYDLKGIHISARHPELPKGYEGFYTRSCYSLEEIEYWKKRSNYVLADSMDSEKLHRYQQAGVINNKVIAHELNSLDDIKLYRDAGFGGILAAQIIWNQFDFHQSSNYKDLITFFKKIRKACG